MKNASLQNLTNAMTKEDIKTFVQGSTTRYSAESLIGLAVRMEAIAKAIREKVKNCEFDNNELIYNGIKMGETTRYDYSNSPAHVYLIEKLESVSAPIKAQIKDVENLAKMLAKVWEKGGHSTSAWTDPETGEVFEVRPAVATSSPKFELK